MKKIIVSAFALGMLGSSAAFADSDKLSAFQGVESAAVSSAELNQVSGEGLLTNILGLGSNLGTILNGNIINNILNLGTGSLGHLGLLQGLTVDSGSSVNTGALVSGVTGIHNVALDLTVN